MSVEATAIIDFGNSPSTTEYIAFIKLDDKSNVGLDGKVIASFGPASTPVVQLHLSNNLALTDACVTDGSIQHIGTVSREENVSNLFASRDETQLSVFRLPVVPTSVLIKDFGRKSSLTASSLVGGIVEYTANISSTPFYCGFTYSYTATLYRVYLPNVLLSQDEEYTVAIVFYLKMVE